ncbi:serine hydrolase domain-containing protein [Streptomyces flavidovirens]|uniref:serine hydrolase domain-containing protein n=1 Tax=Streptomyces flavidovirens TaxID=67298 RepID=UPI0003FF5C05|nr:serine hydrolase domain-containing protein [Streptomyces flavidovirens]
MSTHARTPATTAADDRLPISVTNRVADALAVIEAPDVVLAVSRRGRRTMMTAGTRTPPTTTPPRTPRDELRYEIGSLTKTFTVLLLADLARAGVLSLDDPLAAHLPALPLPHPDSRRITLRHLATHTAGLPRIPADLVPGALLHPYTSGYARYDTERLLRTFARTRPRHRPGTRWHYSNFGVALLAPAMATASGTDYPTLLTTRVLHPLGLTGTTPGPAPTAGAVGHRRDGRTPAPAMDMGAFTGCAGVHSTPGDLLTYAEAHLTPEATPLSLPLRDVQIPQLRCGWRHRETHTLTWYHHPTPNGPLLFHSGATFGQQTFLGFHPPTQTAVAAVATRRGGRCRLVETAYGLLYELAADPLRADGVRPA